jgi:N-acetylmuramoyl-L-alanine amidase
MANRVLIALMLLFSILNATTYLNDIKIEGNKLKLHFSSSLKKKQLHSFVIPSNGLYKYVFDFKNSKKSRKVKYLHRFKGSIKSIRVSQYQGKIVRLVIDSRVKYLLKYSQKNDSVFTITLPDSANSIGEKSVKKSQKKESKPIIRRKVKKKIKDLFKENGGILAKKVKQNKTPSLDLTSPIITGKRRYLIYLDPGHGGNQPGAIYGGIKEKNLVLQIAKRVYKKLKAKGYKVKMTRYRDKRVSLGRRTRMANKANADLFVSIHANAITNRKKMRKVKGLETYFLQPSRTARAKRIAARENREILNSKDKATRDVLLNAVFTGPKIELSHILATSVQQSILSNVRARYSIKDNGVDGAPFRVLVGAQMPAILIEVGYLSNPKERRRLLKSNYQEIMANGIVSGIEKYIKYRERELN